MPASPQSAFASAPELSRPAPEFSLKTEENTTLTLQDFAGKPLVLYFYPKDDTPGCTQEAKDFRDRYEEFQTLGAAVLGVSKDSLKSHAKFREKYCLPFPLGSDEDGAACEAYGTWVEKSMYGKKYMGIDRATFLIDSQGVLRKEWRKVKVDGHIDEILAAIETP